MAESHCVDNFNIIFGGAEYLTINLKPTGAENAPVKKKNQPTKHCICYLLATVDKIRLAC